jgi:hypothetical protein
VPAVTTQEIIFKGHLAAEKMGEIWVMDPKNGMGYGVIEFYEF